MKPFTVLSALLISTLVGCAGVDGVPLGDPDTGSDASTDAPEAAPEAGGPLPEQGMAENPGPTGPVGHGGVGCDVCRKVAARH